MHQFVYILFGIFLLLVWYVIYFFKKDIRKRMVKASLFGGFSGLIAEYWYLKDYWRPPTVLGNAIVSVEDFFVGFVIIGISMALYNFVFNKKAIRLEKPRKKLFLGMFAIGILSMICLPYYLGYNTMLVSPIAFLIFTAIIIHFRRDLIRKAIFSGLLLLLVVLPIYALLFNVISPDYWSKYWLLANTSYGVKVLGNIPLIEIFWYFSWGSFGGVCYDFYSGTKTVSAKANCTLAGPILKS